MLEVAKVVFLPEGESISDPNPEWFIKDSAYDAARKGFVLLLALTVEGRKKQKNADF